METSTPPSFIPHDTIQTTVQTRHASSSGGGLGDIFVVLAVILCVASAALAGAVFLYGQYLDTTETSMLEDLQRAQNALNPATFTQYIRLEDRMVSAHELLQSHIAPGLFFDALNQNTLTTVSFKSLDVNAIDPSKISIKMEGVAQSVNSIARQSEQFGKNPIIANPIFAGISRQEDGVHFTVSASLKPHALAYDAYLAGTTTPAQATAPLPVPTQQPAGPASPFERSTGNQPAPVQTP